MKAEDYSQGEAFQAEKRTIFSTAWLPVCAAGQIGQAGDFLSATVGGWGVVAVRDKAGTVSVLRNACRHQNMPVVGVPSGTCETFRCRFHGWTYDLAGKFVTAPAPVAPADALSPEVNLVSFTVAQEAGLVFFTLAEKVPPLTLDVVLPPYGSTIATDIACNWKVLVEHLLLGQRDEARDFAWCWPLLALRQAGALVIVEQVVPHTFLRTRLLTHVFGGRAEEHKPSGDMIKQACEHLQTDRSAGTMAIDDNALLADFHRQLDTAYAASPTTT
jgi:nitrite reductase/ring-hydroxylating ferredoxin subunit